MQKIIPTILTILLILCSSCFAGEVSIGYAPFCKHLVNDSPNYNENINLMVVSYDEWYLTTFNNSNYDRTISAGYNFRTSKYHVLKNNLFFRGNLFVGLMYGYGDDLPNLYGISPAAAPTVEIGYKKFSVHTMIVPVTSVMLSWTF